MNKKSIAALYRKEMMDIFRDKKTILMMVGVPLLLYPLMMVVAMFAANALSSSIQEKSYRVAFDESGDDEQFLQIIENADTDKYHLGIVFVSSPEDALKNGEIDTYVTSVKKEGQIEYTIQYNSSKDASVSSAVMVEDMLWDYRESLRKESLQEAALDVDAVLYPIAFERVDSATTEAVIGTIMGSILPFLLITSILLGAIYPAIDVTAGERERGTLETLLTLPVSNFDIIISKFLAVAGVAIVSALLNLLSMGFVYLYMMNTSAIATGLAENIEMSRFIPGVLIMILCILAFAMLVTALCLCICIFAKSFKEAQNYSTPILFIFMMAGYAGVIPGITLSQMTAAIPVVNITLLVKAVFNFQYDFALIAIVLFTNVAYSGLAILFMGKIYNQETILFQDGISGMKLFDSRSDMKTKQIPGIGDLVLLLTVLVLLIIYGGSYAQLKLGFHGVTVQQAMILLLPLIYAWYMKCDGRKIFALRLPKLKDILGSLLLWAGSYCIVILISVILAGVFPESADNLQGMSLYLAKQSPLVLFLVIAIMPAIGEEILFRGFVFGTMRERFRPVWAIILSGIIFGLYHMSLIKAFSISVLGMALAISVYYSGSIITSMLMHLCNNALSVLAMAFPEQLSRGLPFLMKTEYGIIDCLILLLVGVTLSAAGIAVLRKGKKRTER